MLKITRLTIVFALMLVALPFALADSPTDGREGREGRAELRFLQGMIDHHQMALDMAQDCLSKATTERVVTLCQNVIDAQSAEIELMQGWLLEWYNVDYEPMPMMHMMEMMDGMDMGNRMEQGGHGGHGGHGNMNNMPFTDPPMMMGMFAGFNRLEGIAYEIAWLESMIDHHDDALHMSQRLLMRAPNGHTALLELAEQIVADQTAEIELMETMIAELGG